MWSIMSKPTRDAAHDSSDVRPRIPQSYLRHYRIIIQKRMLLTCFPCSVRRPRMLLSQTQLNDTILFMAAKYPTTAERVQRVRVRTCWGISVKNWLVSASVKIRRDRWIEESRGSMRVECRKFVVLLIHYGRRIKVPQKYIIQRVHNILEKREKL